MNKSILIVTSIVFCMTGTAHALSEGGPGGDWPKTWPKELEPLRKQAWSWSDGLMNVPSYDIAFDDREAFEAAWPHFLKLKSDGASITLVRGLHVRVWTEDAPKGRAAGIRIHAPLKGVKSGPLSMTRIMLVVDGEIVDLNRLRLPENTPIIDRRFPEIQKKAPVKKKQAPGDGAAAPTAPATEK